jgi:anti-anti-sigma factor
MKPEDQENSVGFHVENADGDVGVVRLSQETLEASNINDFRDKIEPVLDKYTRVVFDMSQLRFIDSMGCSLLLSFLKKLQKDGGGLKVCCATAAIHNLFSLMNFDRLFGIYTTREEAVKAFQK